MWIATLIATFILYWIYDGYGRFLQLLCLARRPLKPITATTQERSASLPSITLLLTVHNEERAIRNRLQNLLDCDYPADRFQILVASDGSTDQTNEIVRTFDSSRVRLFESPGLGKTGTQNAAIREITSDIIAFTDADIIFDHAWLRTVADVFDDPDVGAVDGRLLYGEATAAMQTSQG
ncbi:MAG: glycosyltransferase, partial [Planctomycetota bacterium]